MNKKIILIAIIFLLAISIPYLVSTNYLPKDYHFNGFLLNPIDGHSYLAKMEEGRSGAWLFKLPYSSQPGEGVFLFTYYIFLGHIAGILTLPNIVIFHIVRLINACILFLSVVWFAQDYFGKERSFFPISFIIFGSGLGWFFLPFGYFGSDFKIPEIYPFLSSFTNPHFPLAIGLMLVILKLFRMNIRFKFVIFALLSIILAIIQPFCLIIILGIVGILSLIEWQEISKDRIFSFCSLLIPTLAFGAYLLYIMKSNSMIREWNSQNLTPTPPIWDLVISLSPIIIPAIAGIFLVFKTNDRKYYPLVIWAVMVFVLAYLPLNLQRRLLIGSYIPVCILGVNGLNVIFNQTSKIMGIVKKIIFGTALPSNLLLIILATTLVMALNPNMVMKKSLMQSFLWIDQNLPAQSLILCSPDIGLYIPAYSNNRVIYGHPFETANAEQNKRNVESFFTKMTASEQKIYVETEGIDFIFVNDKSIQLTPIIIGNPVYDENDIKIFPVNK